MAPTMHRCSFPSCTKAFKKPSDLKRHKRVHTGERPFKCRLCDSRFPQSNHCKVHERTHTGEKPCICEKCGTRMSDPSAMSKHKKTCERRREGGSISLPSVSPTSGGAYSAATLPAAVPVAATGNTFPLVALPAAPPLPAAEYYSAPFEFEAILDYLDHQPALGNGPGGSAFVPPQLTAPTRAVPTPPSQAPPSQARRNDVDPQSWGIDTSDWGPSMWIAWDELPEHCQGQSLDWSSLGPEWNSG